MTLWRYTAVTLAEPRHRRRGELSAEAAVDVRASLRRVGLQVISIRPVRPRPRNPRMMTGTTELFRSMIDRWHQHLRSRRRSERAELYDSLSTMLESGLPLTEAVDTLLHSRGGHRSRLRPMLAMLREHLRGGQALGSFMSNRPDWFETTEVAMVEAGQHSGELAVVLRTLCDRHQQGEALTQRLLGALAYPCVVSVVAVGVVIFMSTRTLPQLLTLLDAHDIAVPKLTVAVMNTGQWLTVYWPIALLLLITGPFLMSLARQALERRFQSLFQRLGRIPISTPRLLRRIAVAGLCARLADLLQAGIPLVDALRHVGPTVRQRPLHQLILHAAERIERGDSPAQALSDSNWLDAEFQRLVELGEHSGELDVLLRRLAERYQRQAARLIDRFTRILEPAVIIALTALVGIVVMAAILPLVRLQEML